MMSLTGQIGSLGVVLGDRRKMLRAVNLDDALAAAGPCCIGEEMPASGAEPATTTSDRISFGASKGWPRRSLGEFVARLNAAACALGISVNFSFLRFVCKDVRPRAQRRSDAARPRHAVEQWTNDGFN